MTKNAHQPAICQLCSLCTMIKIFILQQHHHAAQRLRSQQLSTPTLVHLGLEVLRITTFQQPLHGLFEAIIDSTVQSSFSHQWFEVSKTFTMQSALKFSLWPRLDWLVIRSWVKWQFLKQLACRTLDQSQHHSVSQHSVEFAWSKFWNFTCPGAHSQACFTSWPGHL